MRGSVVLFALLLLGSPALAQQNQCRTSPPGASTAYCSSEAFVTESIAAIPAGGTVTEQKNTAGAGLSISGNCDNTSSNAGSPCQYALSLTGAVLDANPANPTATASSTGVMMGIGKDQAGSGAHPCAITLVYSTRLHVTIDGTTSNGTAGTNVSQTAKFGTGTAPSNGAAFTGTTVGSTKSASISAGTGVQPFSISANLAGLTPSTAYWFDLDVSTSTGTGTLTNVHCAAMEF